MTRLRTTVLALITVLAGALLSAPTAASAAESAQRAGHRQVFVLIQTDPTEEDGGPIAARGSIHAKGIDIITGRLRDRFEFPDGNVIIRHKPRRASQQESFDEVTCLFTFRERGTWRAVRGTGAYADVRGHGRYRSFGQGFGCSETEPPETFFVRIRAKGHLRY